MNCFKPAVDFAISYLCKPLILVYRAELELFDTIRYGVTYVISCSIPSGPNNELVCNIHNTRCFKRAVKTPPPTTNSPKTTTTTQDRWKNGAEE